MQLIWLAGPAATVTTYAITRRGIMLALVLAALFIFVGGGVFGWCGLLVAKVYSPELVRQLGGVASQAEFERTKQAYREEVQVLQGRMVALGERVAKLEEAKGGVLERLVLENLLREGGGASIGGRGGLSYPVGLDVVTSKAPMGHPQTVRQQIEALEAVVTHRQRWWEKGLRRLDRLPWTVPLDGDFYVSSGFGIRSDPFDGELGQHKGVDLVAPLGTPVLATAAGRVTRSERSGAYGEWVEVEHAEGFATRYAHMTKRRVKVGQSVARRDVVGWLGSTGRSTGPHLHYEVRYLDEPMHPVKALIAWAQVPRED